MLFKDALTNLIVETFWQPTASAIQVSVSGKDDAS